MNTSGISRFPQECVLTFFNFKIVSILFAGFTVSFQKSFSQDLFTIAFRLKKVLTK